MESPIEVVRRFCAAWSDNMGAAELAAFFTEDAVYHNIPQVPVTGREAIADTIASVLRPGPPGIESIEFRVINIAANGPVVMTERVDVFRLAGRSFELQVMGTFEGELDFETYRDEYQEGLREIIDAKVAGREVVAPEVEAPPKVVNLMDALRRSLDSISATKKKPLPVQTAAKAVPKKRARA